MPTNMLSYHPPKLYKSVLEYVKEQEFIPADGDGNYFPTNNPRGMLLGLNISWCLSGEVGLFIQTPNRTRQVYGEHELYLDNLHQAKLFVDTIVLANAQLLETLKNYDAVYSIPQSKRLYRLP